MKVNNDKGSGAKLFFYVVHQHFQRVVIVLVFFAVVIVGYAYVYLNAKLLKLTVIMIESMSSSSQTTSNVDVSDVYFKCRFCKEEMYYKGPQFPTLKELKKQHANVCEGYAKYRANNKTPEEIEEEERRIKNAAKQQMFACLRFALQACCYDIPRLKAKLADPAVSSEEKRFKLPHELREAQWIQEQQIIEMEKLLKDENPIRRAGAKEEWNRCHQMKNMKERRSAYRLF